ncbi:hypothetical protein Vadar_018983 [Vaccinium darrowii]|uniref:Uncharacterized protein n=1 Tax=Vaccinium darrowii TaxID=229202 RepID=A0ACB7XS76_9ERIC|nr:hypothetical protein Vadar_018983 [Vaccinium darrowii]
MIEKKIEPWFRRELEAILGDPDPSVIVHVASSLFISGLQDSALMNQHLLFFRRFAESPFNMETYDTVVEYRKCSG